MALIVSATSGNFNVAGTWVGGVVPTTGDEARASNGHTVTINVNATVDTVSQAGTGTFVFANGVTLTANLVSAGSGATTVLVQLTGSNSATVVGTIAGSTGANAGITTLANLGTGTLTITGNLIGSTSASSGRNCVQNRSSGAIVVTGNVTGGSGNSANSVLENTASGTITLTGNVLASVATLAPCRNASTGTFNITGNLTASNAAPAFESTNMNATNALLGNFESSAQGALPFYAQKVILGTIPTQNTFTFSVDGISSTAIFYTADALPGMPDEADVKDGITYGPSSELTGTFEQTVSPSIEGIAAGVWDYALSSITTSDTIGLLLKTNIDATISSRSTATTAGIADAVWDELLADHTTNGSFGARIVRSLNSNNTLQLTGSHHAAADVHEFQNEVIADYAFAPSAVTLFTDAVRTELATELTAITELHLIHGLKNGSTLTVTPTSRSAGSISQTIGGDGTNSTTVSRD